MLDMRHIVSILLSVALSSTTLLVDYTAPASVSELGSPQLESREGNFISASEGGSHVYIETGQDEDGRKALHFHRDATYRRAEVKAKGNYAEGKKYFVGYEFRLSNVHQHLALFQWKKVDKFTQPVQNIPFNIQFTEKEPTRLSVGYTPPGEKYETIWTSTTVFSTNETHNIALSWDTIKAKSGNKLQMWLDGKSVLESDGLDLWTGETYPKFGIYRGERGDHDDGDDSNIFDSWIYKVQISDEGMHEVEESSG
ncbi:MAG: hypothetical protein Q9217_005889, partial [Psora testacea]